MLKFTEWRNWSNWEGILGYSLGYSLGTLPLAILKGLAVLAKYGSNAHLFIPGVGKINGIQAGNFLDSTGLVPAVLFDPIGCVSGDYSNSKSLIQNITENKPLLNQKETGVYFWQKGVSPAWLDSAPLLSGSGDYLHIIVYKPHASDTSKIYISSPSYTITT